MWAALTFFLILAYMGIVYLYFRYRPKKNKNKIFGPGGGKGDNSQGIAGDFGSPASLGDTDGED